MLKTMDGVRISCTLPYARVAAATRRCSTVERQIATLTVVRQDAPVVIPLHVSVVGATRARVGVGATRVPATLRAATAVISDRSVVV